MTEDVKWGKDLVFSVGVKMFVATSLEPGNLKMSLKATPGAFAELVERLGLIPRRTLLAPLPSPRGAPAGSIPWWLSARTAPE